MPKIYLSPAAHGNDNPCSYDSACGENIHCNLYMDELEPYLLACGFAVKRNPKDRTGDRLKEAIAESNAWGADLHYVAHTNAGGGSYSLLMVYDQGTAYGYAEKLAARRREIYAGNVKIQIQPQWAELQQTVAPAIYDEMVFHDNVKEITWFHEHLREMAETTAKAICDMFGVAFVDPYAKPDEPDPEPTPEPDGDVWYRVQVGAFREKANADRLCAELQENGYAAFVKAGE